MKLTIKKSELFIQISLIILVIYIATFFYVSNFYEGIAYVLLFLFIFILTQTIRRGLGNNITIIAFLITFFTFLLTRIFIPLFADENELMIDIGGGREFNREIQSFINFTIFLSLLSVYIGYEIIYLRKRKIHSVANFYYHSSKIIRIRNFSKWATCVFSLFALINIIDQIRYVFINGYMDFYLNYENSIPYIIVFLATFFDFFFIFYMATMPSKKQALPIIVLYLLINMATLGMGQRGGAVLAVMFVITYFFLRNKINPGPKPWITKKGIISIALFVPFAISMLFLIAYIRTDKNTDTFDKSNLALNFFYQQGVTVNVVGFVKDYENKLPKEKFYSVGKIIEFAKHNIVSQLIFGTEAIKPQTKEHALEDNTLHATLTYFESPNLYFSGGGYGGCYIADLWADFGILGIIIGNILYGICLAKIREWCSESFWKASVGLLMYTCFLFAPRSNYIDFIYVFVPYPAIISYLTIYLVYKCSPIQKQIRHFIESKCLNQY